MTRDHNKNKKCVKLNNTNLNLNHLSSYNLNLLLCGSSHPVLPRELQCASSSGCSCYLHSLLYALKSAPANVSLLLPGSESSQINIVEPLTITHAAAAVSATGSAARLRSAQYGCGLDARYVCVHSKHKAENHDIRKNTRLK